MMTVFCTGALGLVGSEAVKFFLDNGNGKDFFRVVGIDNNMRKKFFGADGDVSKNKIKHKNYKFYDLDIRHDLTEIMKKEDPTLIIHAAAQPSHDWATKNIELDFSINAIGTLNLLETYRRVCPHAVFIYVSTNKVYGDNPNKLGFTELETRFECSRVGIDETMSLDNCKHSFFGVSKLTGDLLTQEYGKYFGLRTGVFRCGCITGKAHAGAELHGFISYLVRCKKERRKYKVFGYKGKQVRDNIHAHDLVNAFYQFYLNPRPGEVYNMGGGRESNISVLEALKRLDMDYDYVDTPRKGDHIWYISDTSKFKKDFPEWKQEYGINEIFEEYLL